ncbi:small acid-soluble spore protein [Mesobacillus boroniphilus JCM 21738]|uniref:Small, acid-soluble spore protein gamma-type n=1 Tax=Mesobacillus boroniphilus JCM 21738 TaxID=1294265 RepID=W4RS52_9BACI|nr:gamma-type small acid-soluble spore protein [Mesobacillus boroniphilus]GAE46449.1 small acid-soluble spore protein [Mesobacillus boroniphilus JCM 21738]
MAKQPNQSQAGTNIQQVRQQNAQSAKGGQYGTEFASETNAQEVRQQNQQLKLAKAKTLDNSAKITLMEGTLIRRVPFSID